MTGKECGKEVSTEAKTCPNCGVRIKAKSIGCGTYIVALIVVLIIIAAFSGTKSNTPSNPVTQSSTSSGHLVSTPTPDLSGSQWRYYNYNDEMGKGMIYQAEVSSTNTVNFDFPYSGAQHGTLSLRTHPRYGNTLSRQALFQLGLDDIS